MKHSHRVNIGEERKGRFESDAMIFFIGLPLGYLFSVVELSSLREQQSSPRDRGPKQPRKSALYTTFCYYFITFKNKLLYIESPPIPCISSPVMRNSGIG